MGLFAALTIAGAAANLLGGATRNRALDQQAEALQKAADYNSRRASITAATLLDDARENTLRAARGKNRAIASHAANTAAAGATMDGTAAAVQREAAREYDVHIEDTMRRAKNEAANVLRAAEYGQFEAGNNIAGIGLQKTANWLSTGASLLNLGTDYYVTEQRLAGGIYRKR